ncbi:unnamed protein product, partial [Rotaria magnacalcarata]
MCIEKGEIICLSDEKTQDDNLSDQQLERLKELCSKIQLTKRIGPEIDIDRDRIKTITKHDCEGDSL